MKVSFIHRKARIGFKFLILFVLINFTSRKQEKMSSLEYSRIQEGFITPHEDNKVWCYYYWIGDDISKEGVTKDLQAMKEFGIGAVLIGNINPEEVDGRVPLFSDEWWDITTHVVNEGHRLGIDIGFFNSPGWSQSGGPWVTSEKAMRHLVYSETTVSGRGKQTLQLEKPAEEFQDTYVLAFRKIEAEEKKLTKWNASIRCNPDIKMSENLLDGDITTEGLFYTRDFDEYTIDIKADNEIEARSLVLFPSKSRFRCNVELLVEQDGKFKSLTSFQFNRIKDDPNCGPRYRGPFAVALPATKATSFRLICKNLGGGLAAGFSEIVIAENEVLDAYIEKSLGKLHETPQPEFDTYVWESQLEVADVNQKISETIDLSSKMDQKGKLAWDVPEGEWTVLRIGMTPTGTMNSPAAPQGKGYEIDKASSELVKFHFEQFMGEIRKRIPDESRSALKYVIADSYEMGSQNWTDGFEQRFEAKYGYNPVKYLPTLSGRIVSSVEESDRFLWDLRRAVADDIAYEYVGGLKEISNHNNMKLWLENYGHWGFPSEFLMYGGQSDLVSGEFWNEGTLGNIECKTASSAAHMYGKPITSAEAFTASGLTYKRHPAMLKARGDWSFTEGINHLVLHVYIHQPDDKRIPGVNAWFSTEFNRHNTWFKQGKHWVDYLRRCQHMLQQGNYAADILYFIGEDAPKMTGIADPEMPSGYSYDYINAEVILQRLSVQDGAFVLPDGMKYRILALPKDASIRPETLEKLAELVKQGGAILGSGFTKSPSLQNYPACDEKIIKLSSELWGEEKEGLLNRQVGKGYVMDGMGLQDALDFLEVTKDIEIGEKVPVLWTHRILPGMEIYFLTNQSEEEVSFEPSFRVNGMKPQLWDAVTGEIRPLVDYSEQDGRITVPIKMLAHQSWFIVFSNIDENIGTGFENNFPEFNETQTIDSEWSVDFQNKAIGPDAPVKFKSLTDWSLSEDEKIKYYSGTATYETSFELNNIPENGELFVNLGNVGVMAEVRINDLNIGGTWMAPYRIKASGHLKKGVNKIEIEVVNLWRNQLIKDKKLPKEDRYTWHLVDDIKEGEALQPSGLIGPVRIETYY